MKINKSIAVLISLISFLLSTISCEKREFKSVAKVETKTISDLLATTALATGDIIDLGTGITDYGHCWNLSPNPTIAYSHTSLGSVAKKGTFTSELQNLEPGKTYYINAYIKSEGDILYGKKSLSFTTPGNPLYVKATIGNATPSILEMTYDLTLANIIPPSSAFTVQVNSVYRSVDTVAISGTKVSLTLSTPVVYGDVVTFAYTKPATNPLQTASGGQAATITAQSVTNNVNPINPVYVSSAIGNSTPSILEMTYNLALANIVPSISAFTVQVNSLSRTVNNVAISGTKVQLTLASPVVYGDVVTVAYTKPATNPLQTASGGQAVTITAQSVTNNVNPINPVYVSSAIGNSTPSILEMTYNLTLANIVPSISAFTIQVNSLSRTVNTVAISGTKVQLTLASPVVFGDVVTVAYTKPATNPLQTASGGQAATITAQSVTNNVNPINPVSVSSAIGNSTPSILEMTYNLALANIVPSISAFTIQVNSLSRTVNTVAISGTKVQLTLASPVVYGDVVTVGYTKPATNPLQTSSGGQAATITAQSVTNNVNPINPVYVSSAIGNSTPSILEMTYNLTLANIVPAASAFTVQVNSVSRTVSTAAISGTKVQLTLASPVVFGDVVTVAYTKPATNPLQTASGGQAATITAQSVTNNVNPINPVYVSSAIGNSTPSILEMTYNLALANIVPSISAFTVQVNSLSRTVNNVAISGTKVQLTLASPVVFGDVVTVAYTKPATNPLQTASGGQAATITAQSVTNNVNPINPVYVSSAIGNSTPSILEMTYNLTLANIVPAASAFTVQVNSVSRTVSTVAISGTKVQLTLASPVIYGDVVTVAYTKPATNPLQTSSGGQAVTVTAQSVTNNVNPINPIYVSSAIGNATPSILEMIYNLTLANIVPAISAFTVQVNSVSRTVSTVSIIGSKVQLTLASPVVYGDVVTVAYTKPAINPIQTASGGQAATITAQTVTNNITTIMDKDGNVYNTVTIGTQVWMTENLKTTKYNDDTAIPNITDNAAWSVLITPSYCWYNNEITNKDTYGALYNWYTVSPISNGGKNVCPTGWHVPNDSDWTTLTTDLGGLSVAGGKLKETGNIHWVSPIPGATNETGFTALPGGNRVPSGGFSNIGLYGLWWSSTEVNVSQADYRAMYSNYNSVGAPGDSKQYGFSVRCLRDF